MSIKIQCPNGHKLTAKESQAGKIGKCPVCKSKVQIPVMHKALSDSSVLNILGAPGSSIMKQFTESLEQDGTPPKKKTPKYLQRKKKTTATSTHIKACPNCEREINLGYHICPHCHTYITGLNDF
jgi:RNA polymerase subunit RPABC4/transcription elongation factor Spt4